MWSWLLAYNPFKFGNAQNYQRNWKEELEIYFKALNFLFLQFGPEHPDVALTRNEIGKVGRKQEKFEDCLQYFEEPWAMTTKEPSGQRKSSYM